jgi:hypothetical protein
VKRRLQRGAKGCASHSSSAPSLFVDGSSGKGSRARGPTTSAPAPTDNVSPWPAHSPSLSVSHSASSLTLPAALPSPSAPAHASPSYAAPKLTLPLSSSAAPRFHSAVGGAVAAVQRAAVLESSQESVESLLRELAVTPS